jgi:transposase
VTAGQAGETEGFGPALASVKVPRPAGRPRSRPRRVAGDKAYDHRSVRLHLRRLGIGSVIPSRRRPEAYRPRRGRPPSFDREAYRRRNAVERLVGRLKEFRRLATRYEKLAMNYLAVAHVASVALFLRALA